MDKPVGSLTASLACAVFWTRNNNLSKKQQQLLISESISDSFSWNRSFLNPFLDNVNLLMNFETKTIRHCRSCCLFSLTKMPVIWHPLGQGPANSVTQMQQTVQTHFPQFVLAFCHGDISHQNQNQIGKVLVFLQLCCLLGLFAFQLPVYKSSCVWALNLATARLEAQIATNPRQMQQNWPGEP